MGRESGTTGYSATISLRDVVTALLAAAVLVLVVTAGDESPDHLAEDVPAVAPLSDMVEPVQLEIPSINVDATVRPTGIAADGTIEVPPLDQPQIAGWYDVGPSPGQPGAAVILGHLTTPERGVFYDLASLDEGALIEVSRADGSVAVFAVDRVTSTAKSAFPVVDVYGPADGAVLRLITCGGEVDEDTLQYEGNVIAYASLVEWND
jgi:hypothetical protein